MVVLCFRQSLSNSYHASKALDNRSIMSATSELSVEVRSVILETQSEQSGRQLDTQSMVPMTGSLTDIHLSALPDARNDLSPITTLQQDEFSIISITGLDASEEKGRLPDFDVSLAETVSVGVFDVRMHQKENDNVPDEVNGNTIIAKQAETVRGEEKSPLHIEGELDEHMSFADVSASNNSMKMAYAYYKQDTDISKQEEKMSSQTQESSHLIVELKPSAIEQTDKNLPNTSNEAQELSVTEITSSEQESVKESFEDKITTNKPELSFGDNLEREVLLESVGHGIQAVVEKEALPVEDETQAIVDREDSEENISSDPEVLTKETGETESEKEEISDPELLTKEETSSETEGATSGSDSSISGTTKDTWEMVTNAEHESQ